MSWDDLATHDDLTLLRVELRSEMAELRLDMRADLVELENRLQRSIITWILAAQGITLAATSLLVTVLAFTLG